MKAVDILETEDKGGFSLEIPTTNVDWNDEQELYHGNTNNRVAWIKE